MKNLENVLGELEFLNTEVLAKLEKVDMHKLNERLEKIDSLKIDIDKEYIDNLKSELNERRKTLFEMLDEEIRLSKNAKKDLDESKTFLLNVLKEIKKENENLRKDMKKSLSSFNKFTYLVAFAAAVGYYAGLHHFFIFH